MLDRQLHESSGMEEPAFRGSWFRQQVPQAVLKRPIKQYSQDVGKPIFCRYTIKFATDPPPTRSAMNSPTRRWVAHFSPAVTKLKEKGNDLDLVTGVRLSDVANRCRMIKYYL